MNRKKNVITAFAVAIMCLVPLFSNAQIIQFEDVASDRATGDGGIGGGWGTAPIVDSETNEYAPLGNGFWVLAASAGLYLLVKSKKSRRTKTVMLAALALTLGTTQCHKSAETVNVSEDESSETKTIHISLTCGNGMGPKADIDVSSGNITWNLNDKVYVVYDGKLLSTDYLTVTQISSNPQWGTISGSIEVTEEIGENPTFTFYYVGSGVDFTPTASATSLTFDISDQSDGKDVGEYMVGRTASIAMEVSGDKYGPAVQNSAVFKPLSSVLRVKTDTDFGECQMNVTGNKALNQMEVDLGSPDALNCTHTADITFQGGADVAVSVMPATAESVSDEEAQEVVLVFTGNGKVGSLTMNYGIKPGRVYAKVLGSLTLPILVSSIEGVLPGAFSVDESRQVFFSPGNLQYIGSATKPYFKFADNQWNYIGGSYGSGQFTKTNYQKADRDLFAWGTSGYDNKYSYMISSKNGDYYRDNIAGTDYDWGQYNDIVNPSSEKTDPKGTWRTPTWDEWSYLLFTRKVKVNGVDKTPYLLCNVNGKYGLLVLPDNWDGSQYAEDFYGNVDETKYTFNESTTPTWSAMEAAGVVFLPAAGGRSHDGEADGDYAIRPSFVDKRGCYCSSTIHENGKTGKTIWFAIDASSNHVKEADQLIALGFSVRLVKDVASSN